MKDRLPHDCTCIFLILALLLLEILPPIYHARVINETCRTKGEISARATLRSRENANYATEVQKTSLKREREDGNLEEDAQLRWKHRISKRSANPVNANSNNDLRRSNAEESIGCDDRASQLDLQRSGDESADYAAKADERITKQEEDKDEETSELVRVVRDANADPDRYTDQDERSSLYDDYEAKDIAKRGVLGGPEDYEEMEEDSPGALEDMVAVREREPTPDEGIKKREVRSDSRVQGISDRAAADSLNKAELNPNDLLETEFGARIVSAASRPIDSAKLKESKVAPKDEAYSREPISRVEPSEDTNEASIVEGVSGLAERGSNGIISTVNDTAKIEEPTSSAIASSKGDSSIADYERRADERIQRKIDSIKNEIRRDIEAQRRTRDIRENNARFDELRDREREDEEERQRAGDGSIEKRENTAERSTREAAEDAVVSAKSGDEKRSSSEEQREKLQRQSTETDELGASRECLARKNAKKRSVTDRDESSERSSSMGTLRKKRERVRQTILTNNERRRAKKRHARSYALPSERNSVDSQNELSARDLNSYLLASDKMAPLPLVNEDDDDEGERSAGTAARPNSLVSLTGSSQELSPRLAKEYKEAFGGLQSESGGALARFKRIKRVLGPDAKI